MVWLCYTVLDAFFALYARAWPLTWLCYCLFAVPLEIAFYLHTRRFRHVRSLAPNCAKDSREARRCWERVLAEDTPEAIERGLRSWFAGEGDLAAEDVTEVLSLLIYNAHLADLHLAQRAVVDSMRELVEAALGKRLPDGRNPQLRCLASYVVEGLDACNKPLVYYLCQQTLEGIIWWVYRRVGFELRCSAESSQGVQNLQYWYLPERTARREPSEPSPPPVVILHGVGGLLPYCVFILHFAWRTRGAIIVPLFAQCSLSAIPAVTFSRRPPMPSELAAQVRQMLRQCGASKAAFFAHSFGTAVLAALLKRAPDMALACTFVDPICFQLHTAAIVSNFLLAEPTLSAATWVHFVQKAFATLELTLQDGFRRRFWWANHCLAPSDVPCDSTVILAGRDTVANVTEVRRQLLEWQQALAADDERLPPGKRAPRVHVEFHEGYFHGQIFAHVTEQRRIIEDLLASVASVADGAREAAAQASLQELAERPLPEGRAPTSAIPHAPPPRSVASTPPPAALKTVSCALAGGVVRRVRMADALKRAARFSDDDAETASMGSSAWSPSEASSFSPSSPADGVARPVDVAGMVDK